jgi:hypothetical protein
VEFCDSLAKTIELKNCLIPLNGPPPSGRGLGGGRDSTTSNGGYTNLLSKIAFCIALTLALSQRERGRPHPSPLHWRPAGSLSIRERARVRAIQNAIFESNLVLHSF